MTQQDPRLASYSKWLIANQDRRDTPEFQKVANAYKQIRANSLSQPQQTTQTSADYNPPGTGVSRALERGIIGTQQAIPAFKATQSAQILEDMDVGWETTLKRAFEASLGPDQFAQLQKDNFENLNDIQNEGDFKDYLNFLRRKGYNANQLAKAEQLFRRGRAGVERYSAEGGFFDETRQGGQDALSKLAELEAEKAKLPMSPTAARGAQDFQDAEGVMDWAKKSFKDPLGALAFIGETAAESGPSIAAGIGTSVVTGNPLLGAGIMIATSAPREYGGEVIEFMRDQGIDFSNPNAIRAAIDNPDILREASKRGLTRAAIISAFEAIGMKGGGGILLQSLKQAGTGGLGDATAQYATDGEVVLKEAALEAVAELATTPGEVAIKAGRSFFNKKGDFDPSKLTNQEKLAGADVARILQSVVEENGYNLKDLDVSSEKGAKKALEAVRRKIISRIDEITKNKEIKKYFNSATAKSLGDINLFAEANGGIKAAKNKVADRVTQSQIDAIRRLMPPTQEAQELLNLMAMSNVTTDLFNRGMKGGISRYTDYFNPLIKDGSYDPSRMANIIVGTSSTYALGPAATAGIVAGGRTVDAITGRRAVLDRFLKKNVNKEGLADPGGPSLLALKELQKKLEQQKLDASKQETLELNRALYDEGVDPAGLDGTMDKASPEAQMMLALEVNTPDGRFGPDRTTINSAVQAIIDNPDSPKALVKAAETYLTNIRDGGKIPKLTPLIQAVKREISSNPDVYGRTRASQLSQGPAFSVNAPRPPSGDGSSAGDNTSSPAYQAGIQRNLTRVDNQRALLNANPTIPAVEKAQLNESLNRLRQPLTNPVVAVQQEIQRLNELGVDPASIDLVLSPIQEAVTSQQRQAQGLQTPTESTQQPALETAAPAPAEAQTEAPAALTQPAPSDPVSMTVRANILTKAVREIAEGDMTPMQVEVYLSQLDQSYPGLKAEIEAIIGSRQQQQQPQQQPAALELTPEMQVQPALQLTPEMQAPSLSQEERTELYGVTFDPEARVPDFLRQQPKAPTALTQTEQLQRLSDTSAEYADTSAEYAQELYAQALNIVAEDGKVSTSYLQRKLGIPYNEAGELVARMEREGYISASNHVGKREILKTPPRLQQPTNEDDTKFDMEPPAIPPERPSLLPPNPLQIPENDLEATNLPIMPSPEEIASMREGSYKPEQKRTLVEAAEFLNNRWQQATGQKEPFEYTPENVDRISSMMATEALQALQNDGNAIGWYDRKIKAAKAVTALVEPRIMQSPDAEVAFDFALAVTSNGQAVADNFEYTVEVFRYFMDKGKMPTTAWTKGGERNEAMVEAFEFFNAYSASGRNMPIQDFLSTDFTVAELDNIIQQFNAETGSNVSVPSSESRQATVKGSYIMGPKIGQGFYQNIRGNYDPLTMDIWWMRMWNRMVGRPFETPKDVDKNRARILEAVKTKNQTDLEKRLTKDALKDLGITRADLNDPEILDQFVVNVEKKYQSFYRRKSAELKGTGQKVPKPELFKASGTMVKNMKPQLQAQPKGPGERQYMREVTQAALAKLNSQGYPITTADFQALMWYPEKQLFRKLGVAPGRGADNDYLDAAKLLAAKEGIPNEQIEETLSASEPAGEVAAGTGAEGAQSTVRGDADRFSGEETRDDREPSLLPALREGRDKLGAFFRRVPQRQEVVNQFPTVKAAIQVGKKGSEYENGVNDIEGMFKVAEALNVVIHMFHDQQAMADAKGVENKGTVRGSFRKTPNGSSGTIFALKEGTPFRDSRITNLEELTTVAHELMHGLNMGPMSGVGPMLNGNGNGTPSIENAIGVMLEKPQGKRTRLEREIIFELKNLQNNISVYLESNPKDRRPVRVLNRQLEEFAQRRGQMTPEDQMAYEDRLDNYKNYIRSKAELTVDGAWVYLVNPKLAKQVMPNFTKWFSGELRKAGNKNIQFYSHPFAVSVAVMMAILAAQDAEDEEKKQQQQQQQQPMMQPGALSPMLGMLTAA